MFRALLDTCVLWPNLQRDVLLTLGAVRLYHPLWSVEILAELREAEELKRLKRGEPEAQAAARAANLDLRMRAEFDEAIVHGVSTWQKRYGLPDYGDEHVVAAAELGNAGVIVTSNLRHFPTDRLPVGLEVKSPHEFLADTIDIDPFLSLRALEQMLSRYGNPPRELDWLIATLRDRYQCIDASALLAEAAASRRK